MLKDVIKNYLDQYKESWIKEFGEPPMFPIDITEEPSACFFGDVNEDGWCQWTYVEQPDPIDFREIEDKYQICVCDEVKQLYNSYLFLELPGFLDGQRVEFNPVTEETTELFFPSDDYPPVDQYSHLIIIGMYGSIEASLCVDIVTGKVYSWDLHDDTYEFEYEERYSDPELLADSLTELISRLQFTNN